MLLLQIFVIWWDCCGCVPEIQDKLTISFTHNVWTPFSWEPSPNIIPNKTNMNPTRYYLDNEYLDPPIVLEM
jgi:hypothetical protein